MLDFQIKHGFWLEIWLEITITMKFDIISIFPQIFKSYFNESIIKRGLKNKFFSIKIHNLRDFTKSKYRKYRKVDDKPYGGGAGMVLMAEPILKTFDKIRSKSDSKKSKIVILSARGKQFSQSLAFQWLKKYNNIILISGRYEGIDERVKKIIKADLSAKSLASVEEVSIGPYVLTDGDVAAMAIISSIVRLIPGVINSESLREESYGGVAKGGSDFQKDSVEYPQYTRPAVIEWKGKKYKVPKVLISGNHKEITDWRRKQQK